MLRSPLLLTFWASACLLVAGPVAAQDTPATAPAAAQTAPNDLLNAALWMQRSVEFKANALAVYALGRIRLDEALADKSASALDQTGAADMPPAVILDLDETVMDNSAYESGLVTSGTDYSSKTWAAWVAAKQAKAIPGSLDYIRYADSKGVKIFYVTNRKADEEAATRANLEALGYPMGGNVDTFLTRDEKPEWKSDKTTRRDFIAKDYRVVAMFGDNFNDFTDKAAGTTEERETAFEALQAHFATDWFMLANPTYGSWESTTFGDDFKLSNDEKRALKVKALQPWTPSP
ncbi:5'-nucleotidase, lipoprotein e(P4) family [Aureimonas glaciei]|uniref:Acid phosphatase n=1 Tax=Aureimonas glaciei TaxID=1776957 RepID=A0A916Y2H1_9HYPH|nr:HAD family acid phosphatase [Aureimonas glaciei]GGD28268.1 acid phosphatase [Aureimonas glaciei]